MGQKHLTSPVESSSLPSGVPYIVGNEAAERFSFYGMKTILFVFMTEYLLNRSGALDVMTPDEAKEYVHWFVASAYFFPIIGAFIADAFLGKYRTILSLSVVYCLGHLALALDETRLGLFAGLTMVAIGTGAIKPCVSAHVGDQFGRKNQHLLAKVFSWFYFSINLGAAASTLITPILLADPNYGPRWAFGLPGVLMLIATVVFWMGRNKFIHVPAGGIGAIKEAFSGDGIRALKNLALIYVFVAMFWSLFDQTGSAWIHQAKRMDRQWLGIEWLPSQIQAANPILILIFIPLFAYIVYPAINRVFPLTPLRKVAIGFFVTVPAFALPAWIESQITGSEVVKISSEADREQWPAENLFDGKVDGSGWVSGELETKSEKSAESAEQTETADSSQYEEETLQDIVIRLRERRAWEINSVRINPETDLEGFLQKNDKEHKAEMTGRVQACWPKDIEILVGETRLGDPAIDEQGNETWKWTRSVGSLSLKQVARFQTLEFSGVSTEYVLIRIKSNWGGKFVSLGEIEVNSSDSLPSDAHPYAAPEWPNVAAIGYRPSIVWQLLSYVLMTAAEIMISITCLEFSYTQAPNKMKSFIMSLYLLSVSAGNAFTALVNRFIQNADESSKLEGAAYYSFFTLVILAAALGFIVVARSYRGQTYIQGEK